MHEASRVYGSYFPASTPYTVPRTAPSSVLGSMVRTKGSYKRQWEPPLIQDE